MAAAIWRNLKRMALEVPSKFCPSVYTILNLTSGASILPTAKAAL
jgi:hypothetical protein